MSWQTTKRFIVFAAMSIFTLTLSCASTQNPTQTPSAKTANVIEKQASLTQGSAILQVPYFPAPRSIELCGEPVPLDSEEVYERFDKEFTLIVYNHAQVYLWLKRMERWFPMIEERLRCHRLPEDLKWVAIVESDLVPNVVSPKGAAGPWQFMPATGSAYGLRQKGSVDKRYDFELSTDGAFLYLQDLNRRFKNWALAIAAYNCGEKRVMDEARSQGVLDYYHLKLPQETERYVIRILAIKAVLSNPGQYGYDLPKGLGYQELRLDRLNVSFQSPSSIQAVSDAAGITYREFKRLNPVFRSDEIPPGNHEIKFPNGYGKVFETNFRQGSVQAQACPPETLSSRGETELPASVAEAQPIKAGSSLKKEGSGYSGAGDLAVKPAKAQPAKLQPVKAKKIKVREYTVKKGDTISEIAHRLDVSPQALKKANRIKSDHLTPGEKLRIP